MKRYNPFADAGPDQVACDDDEVTLDGSNSSAPGGSIVSSSWDANFDENPNDYETHIGDEAIVELSTELIKSLSGNIAEFQLTVTNNEGGLTGMDTMLLAVSGRPCVCVASTMHIESIHAGTYKGKYGKATVTIVDNCGNPVSGASVTGTFTFPDFSETPSPVTTNNEGVAVIYTTTAVKKPSYTFCVDDVTGTLTYDHVETCESK